MRHNYQLRLPFQFPPPPSPRLSRLGGGVGDAFTVVPQIAILQWCVRTRDGARGPNHYFRRHNKRPALQLYSFPRSRRRQPQNGTFGSCELLIASVFIASLSGFRRGSLCGTSWCDTLQHSNRAATEKKKQKEKRSICTPATRTSFTTDLSHAHHPLAPNKPLASLNHYSRNQHY